MKRIRLAISLLLVAAALLTATSCSLLNPSREFKLCENFAFPEVYEGTYGSFNKDGSTTVSYTMTVDATGSMHYRAGDDVEFYYIKGEDGEYTKYKKYNGAWNKSSGTLSDNPKWETAHEPYYMSVGKYALHSFFGKAKKLSDVEYLGRDCYAYKITLEDSTGKSYTVKTVKEVYIDKETCMLMKEIITDFKDPTAPEKTAEKVGTGYGFITFTSTPETVTPPYAD